MGLRLADRHMAIYHHSAAVIKRSNGKSAVASAAYRAGEKILDKRTGITHDYTKKTGVDHSEIITPHLPNTDRGWLLDRAQLWNQVEAFEKRSDSQLAREINIAIPTELDRPTQIALVREYVKTNYIALGMVADVKFHDLQSNNPHTHVMLTMRDLIVTDGRVKFGNKNRDWNRKELLIEQRQSWEILANKYLAEAGYNNVRIDCRSLEEQGVERIPQIHLGANVNSMRLKGISTDRGDHYDEIEKANGQIRADLERVYRESKDRESAATINRPDFERHRRNLSNIGRDDGRSISRQGEIGNRPGADRQTDLETRTNRSRSSQQNEVSKDTRQPIGASSDHSENRPDPDLQSARSTDSTSISNTNFSSTKARLIELSNRAKAGRPGAAASEQRDDSLGNDIHHPDNTGDVHRIRSERDQGQYASGNPADEQPDPRVDRQVSPGASRATEGGKETEAEAQKAQTLADLNKSPEVIVKVKIDKPQKKRSSGMSL
jgi:hypothetical protein